MIDDRTTPGKRTAIRSVAVIGVGAIGAPVARFLLEAGFEVTVCDRDPAAVEPLKALGARSAEDPRACGASDVVIILVATPEQLHDVALGDRGVRQAQTGPAYLVVMSTVSTEDMRMLESAFRDTRTRIVDAPVTGGVLAARNGELVVLAGAEDEALEDLRPIFAAFSRTVFTCGGLGAGQSTKIINNVIAIANLMISAEAYGLALAQGLHLEKLLPILDASSARNFLSRDPVAASQLYREWSKTRDAFDAVRTINHKDLDLALSLGSHDTPLPAIRVLQSLVGKVGEDVLELWRTVGDAQV